ncbi:MAG: TlpA family protein disulfide reductase [Candidatus Marinimicrobia bacterium]|nr:TlpA family protein disulfide reductase [Candidatus Neomarinimicrobiota bacterium]MBL7022786.1 TlpA family protein disulfide reductase [Candidatus Neomarinimicrobiota bacterium]MBL7109488.1 TlpA family protein disulfide reductase [Candidatus Neomarinimicrobiota bacterium]
MKIIFLTSILIIFGFTQEIAPQFYLPTLDENHFFASEVYGAKAEAPTVTVISFFASWCAPCQKEIKALDSLSVKFPDIAFYLVNYKEKKDIVKKWISKMQTDIPILLDNYGLVSKKFKVAITDENGKLNINLPTIFVINKKGEIIYSHTGYDDKDAKILSNLLENL